MTVLQYVAPPISRAQLRRLADTVRKIADRPGAWFDIMAFIELQLPQLDEEFTFSLDETLPSDMHACTDVQRRSITMRPDIYERAVRGHGRDRLTAAHELGHYILHSEVRLNRRMGSAPLQAFVDPEWQANCFAGELLVPLYQYPRNKHPEEAADLFGVSLDAILTQLSAWRREQLI